MAGGDAFGRAGRAGAKNCARFASPNAAAVSRYAAESSGDGRDGDEHGCEHAGPRQRRDTTCLRAMRDLEALNPHPGIATNAMCTFLAINTASVQLIPTTAIAILVAAGSTRPTAIVGTALLATLCAATTAIIAVKILEKVPWFARPVAAVAGRGSGENAAASNDFNSKRTGENRSSSEEAAAGDRGYRAQPTLLGRVATVALLIFFVLIFVRIVW